MGIRLTAAFGATALAALLLAAGAGAAVIGIYRAGLDTEAERGEVGNLYGERCKRGGSERAFRIYVGKRTRECAYSTPVVGRDLELGALGRLLSGTPKPLAKRTYLSLSLRAGGGGARYQLLVFPVQRKVQLRKVLPDGEVTYLAIEKGVRSVQGLNRANRMRLRAFNVTRGPNRGKCRLVGVVGGERVVEHTDSGAGLLQGRASAFSVGSRGPAKGALASFEGLVVRVPSPF